LTEAHNVNIPQLWQKKKFSAKESLLYIKAGYEIGFSTP
jgi:hypothetical protein